MGGRRDVSLASSIARFYRPAGRMERILGAVIFAYLDALPTSPLGRSSARMALASSRRRGVIRGRQRASKRGRCLGVETLLGQLVQ